jgi:dTDP-4-dehydrorhamnose reductase
MKVLVTGSNGLLGQKLLDHYKQFPEIELIATAKGADRYPFPGFYTYCSLDITNEAEVKAVFNSTKPEVVIHTAAMTNVDACELDQTNCDILNVQAVEYIVNASNQINAHLVHLSTDFIFDGTHGPLAEEEIPKPLSYYGLSKYKAEQLVKAHSNSWAILRTVLVYGVVKDMSRSNIVLWAKNALESGKSIQVVADQFRTPTLAEDLAQGCALAAAQKASGIFHISGMNFMSVYDLVIQVADFWNLDKSLVNLSSSEGIQQPAKRPPITGFQIEKAKSILGYQPHTFKEGLQIVSNQLNSLYHE